MLFDKFAVLKRRKRGFIELTHEKSFRILVCAIPESVFLHGHFPRLHFFTQFIHLFIYSFLPLLLLIVYYLNNLLYYSF